MTEYSENKNYRAQVVQSEGGQMNKKVYFL